MSHDAVAPLVVRGLGRAKVSLGDLELEPEAGMLFPLALLLAQRAGERIPRAELIALLWPDASEAAGRHSLRQALYRLRKAGLLTEDTAEDLRVPPSSVDSDLRAMLRHDWPYRSEAEEIERAASVLPGFEPDAGSALEAWLEQLRSRAVTQYRVATLHQLGSARREGRWRLVDHWALMCLQTDPLNEEATLARAEASAMTGAKYAAVEIIDTYLRDLGDHTKSIGLPARLMKRRIAELPDTTQWRVTATSAPFVGRHALLARANDAMAKARTGESTALWFVGPPGMGKSRMLRELARSSRMLGWCAVHGGARPSYESRPLALLEEVLPQMLEAPGALGTDPHALALMRQLGRADTKEEPLTAEEARGRQWAIYLSWTELMDAILSEAPLVVLLDDAHWSDPLTLLMFARYLESRPKARLAVILSTRRMPVREDLAAQRLLGAPQERVGPLTDEEMREFTAAAGLRVDDAFEDVTRRLSAVSGGNPLFLGHLVHQHQTHHGQVPVPPDLSTLIDDQLRELSKEAARLLQACALLGRHATLPRVERVLGVDAPALVAPFGELDDMLALPSEPGQPLTPHDLWTERVRHGMTAGVFRSLAVSAARVLEADGELEGGIELSWDAAQLYQESGEKQLAYGTMMRCAEYLLRTGAAVDACRAYGAAAQFAGSDLAQYEALNGLGRSQLIIEQWSEVLATVDRAVRLEISWTPEREASLATTRLNAEWRAGIASTSVVDELRVIASNEYLSPRLRLTAAQLGMAISDNSLDQEGVRWFFSSIDSVPGGEPSDTLLRLKCAVIFETASGDLERAEAAASKLIALARHLDNEAEVISALKFAHYPARRAGRYSLAVERLESAAQIAKRLKQPLAAATISDMLAGVHLDYGDAEEAITFTMMVTDNPVETSDSFRHQSAVDTRALAYCLLGRYEAARPLVARPAVVLARGRWRMQFMSLAATLLVAAHEEDLAASMECLSAIDEVRDQLFRTSGSDLIALAYFLGLKAVRGTRAAARFARWYISSARRDRLPLPGALAAYDRS